ncbi:MAG: hypothetical protein AAF203_08925, partial [Pseudomonadota bacterium]
MKKKAILFVLHPETDDLVDALKHCADNEISPTIVVPTYSFGLEQIQELRDIDIYYPMDILKTQDVDQAFQDSFSWMRDFSQMKVGDKKICEMTIAHTHSSKMWAWTHLLPAHLFLHFRFVKLISESLKLQNFDFYSIIGDHSTFPWKKFFILQLIHKQAIPRLIYNWLAQKEMAREWLENLIPEPWTDKLSELQESAHFRSLKAKRRTFGNTQFRKYKRTASAFIGNIKTFRKLRKLDRLTTIFTDPAKAFKYAYFGVNDI